MSDGPAGSGRRVADIEAEIRALEARLEVLRAELARSGSAAEREPEQAPVAAAVRVVVADDAPEIRELLTVVVGAQADLEMVGVASDSKEAVREVLDQKPDVALLDLDMPGGGGMWAAQQIMRALPETRIVFFTSHDTMDVQMDVMRAGAVAFLVKGVPHGEIARTIRNAATSPPGRPQI